MKKRNQVMDQKLSFIAFLLCTGLLISCSIKTEVTDESAEEVPSEVLTPAFVASPQPIKEQEVQTLTLGSPAPDFNLPGVDGKYHSLSDYDSARVLVIIFTCNHCPTAQAYEDRMIALTNDYRDAGVQVVAISPNSPIGLLFDELGYSDLGDTYEEMIIRAQNKNFNFPYLYDGDTHEASLKYGPVATPHAFVFDSDRKLRYVGRLDASEKPGTANAEDLRNAIDAVLNGSEMPLTSTKTFGCSVKWAWKDKYKKEVYAAWDAAPVTLEEITTGGITELLKNDSKKLLLVNLWATWCGPCIIEYPDFVEIHRMYDDRDFEFISISADNLEAKEKAHEFLQKSHSALRNFIYSEGDKYALIEAVDPEWNGSLPYTMLIEPGGKVIYRIQGSMDPQEVKRMIVEHPMIGRYY
ncbi:redoxin domain-containing protein [Fulvivirga sedimenti]|uniref:Redoxin domain-containing protein n=1 Tax=Fulvivirga sedimenti TaxID=2879465 RepID=A0A9X1L031_9BACT|nr:redoxin domain-containing protein [Fulvivirga sedimenti]MCA6079025.1 redoxin domain-containing protein [Fulvivirga sedimenti]